MFTIVVKQMVVMGIFMFLGAVLFKTELVSKEGSKTLTNILIYVITPLTIFKSFCIEPTREDIRAFFVSFLLCVIAQGLGLVFSHICFRNRPLEDFATAYPNSGFFGIPVIDAILGSKAVFYMAPLAFLVGTLQYSYGVSLLLGKKAKFDFKRFFLAPNTIGFLAGMFVFFTGLGTKIPEIPSRCISIISNMSSFFALTVLGICFIQADLTRLYKDFRIYLISFLRLLVFPVICVVVFKFIPADTMIKTAVLLAFASPVGANVANYSLLYNKDYSLASLYVAISTVLCLLTLPLFSIIVEKMV